MKETILNINLEFDQLPSPFVIKTMEEIDARLGGIADEPHRHNYYTVIWPFEATGKHVVDFKEYPIQRDHLFFVSPGQVHQVITNGSPTGLVILFTCDFLSRSSIQEDFISNLKLFNLSDDTPPLFLSEAKAVVLKNFALQMMAAFHSDSDLRFEVIGAYLKLFLIECNSSCTLNPVMDPLSFDGGKNLVRNFKTIVDQQYATLHQVQDYAAHLNVSPNYLNEVIKSVMGISAKDYIQNRLVLEAKRMVTFTQKNSKEIGFHLGFDDPSHFSKFFKLNTGMSLAQFKEHVGK